MPEPLLLDSLQVRGFRAFRDLQIPHLGRVNLIVGKNNVGKSSVLEALRLYAENGSPRLIQDLLITRQEMKERVFSSRNLSTTPDEQDDPIESIKNLFYNRLDLNNQIGPIIIGSIKNEGGNLFITVSIHPVQNGNGTLNAEQDATSNTGETAAGTPMLIVQVNQTMKVYGLDRALQVGPRMDSKEIPYVFIAANGLDRRRIGTLWNQMASFDMETDVLSALRIIAPEVQRINLLVDQAGRGEHTPVVKIDGANKLVPLRSMGEGMVRMFGLALALVSARDGMLLIDEVESGLHYSVQADMWRLIFGAAQRFNIQVFATTHSLDCIRGFRKAAVENKEVEGVLIRLQRKKDDITAVLFDEQEVAIATRNQIEVR